MGTFVVILVVVVFVAFTLLKEKTLNDGARNMVCPHCQQKGTVSVAATRVKRGISGGKATAALFTFGTSLLATGLSRKEKHLRARCSNCLADWLI